MLLVTDREVSLPGVVVVGPSAAAGVNFGIIGIVLDGDEMVVAVRSSTTAPADVSVESRPRSVLVHVPPAGVGVARLPTPRDGHVRLVGDDSLWRGDDVVVARTAGARTAALAGGRPFERVRRALAACRVRVVVENPDDAVWRSSFNHRGLTRLDVRW